jgi:PhnB protein
VTDRRPVPEGYHTATPFLIVRDAAGALDFYKKAFGAKERMRHHDEAGRLRHCEIEIGDSAFMIGGRPRAGVPKGGEFPSVCLYLYVDDADSWVDQALRSRAKQVSSVKDQYDGDRRGGVMDPFGIVWWIATRIEDVSPGEMDRRLAGRLANR